jgi:hypothetical protein
MVLSGSGCTEASLVGPLDPAQPLVHPSIRGVHEDQVPSVGHDGEHRSMDGGCRH